LSFDNEERHHGYGNMPVRPCGWRACNGEQGGLTMRWPWVRRIQRDMLAVSWSGQIFSYVLARPQIDGRFAVSQIGVERQGSDTAEEFTRRLQRLGLKGRAACAMLRPEQYQLLQIETPAVAPEELRSAARYQIRDMLDVHVDDITLDVMKVGDGREKNSAHLFVAAAANAVVRSILDLSQAMQWNLSVIDIQESAQRNFQSAVAKRGGYMDRANAALVLAENDRQAMLTISVNEELFFTRRIELPEGLMAGPWGHSSVTAPVADDAYAMVEEYVPGYQGAAGSSSNGSGAVASGTDASTRALLQRFLVEVQRSLDLWDRSWSSIPLHGFRVYAGHRTEEMAQWLSQELGQVVLAMDAVDPFPGFENGKAEDQAICWPLLGVLMRSETRKL
jgi:MSHA biogenesis protein MshI